MIDPVEVVIAFLSSDADLAEMVDERIAAKHRYGEAWTMDQAGVMVRADGGPVDLYVPVQRQRVEVRCYAPDQPTAMTIWSRLVEMSREMSRQPIAVTGGDGMLYAWLPDSGPSLLYDAEARMDFVMCFFEALVGEVSL